jgi:hypothetical protein
VHTKAETLVSPMTALHVELAQWDGRAARPLPSTPPSAFSHRNVSW